MWMIAVACGVWFVIVLLTVILSLLACLFGLRIACGLFVGDLLCLCFVLIVGFDCV